jgi:predicted AlkP superfamily pyrophosphatase or phosphodiesterase
LAFALLFLLAASVMPAALAQQRAVVHPKLILMLVVDQFSYDYLARFKDKFSPRGIRYLEDHGASFTNCRYKQAATVTAIGHCVISSGAYPWSSGVVGNEWFDRKKNAAVEAVADDSVALVGANGQGRSARAMNGTTFGDQLRLVTNGRSRVVALSLKDRSAIMLAGKLANDAFWFDEKSGNFVSSSQWGTALPGFVQAFNDQHYVDRFFNKNWQRLLPESAYVDSTRDDYPFEGMLAGDGRQFPHLLTGGSTAPDQAFYGTFACTPFANDLLVDLAKTAIDQEALGGHEDSDMLAISFSATDSVGHVFGPYSQEAEDTMLRLDVSIAKLLAYVDEKVGLNRCLIVLTGDHGATPIPEFLKERGQQLGLEAGRIDPSAFKTLLNSAMVSRLGQGEWIASFLPPNLYLNLSEIDRNKYRQSEVESLAAKLARSVAGVQDVFTAAQFYADALPASPFADAVKRSYYWGRSGELYVLVRPGFIFSSQSTGTAHGSPYSYDAQVPLIICGTGIASGRYGADSSPADIAATLSALLGITMPPLCEGRVLSEAFAAAAPPVPPPVPSVPESRRGR